MTQAKLADFMTSNPISFPADASLGAARRAMDRYKVRHLLVRDNELIVGVISDRELAVLEAMDEIDDDAAPARLAMQPEPYHVKIEETIGTVCKQMIENHIGSVVVLDDEMVVGIFTTTDALRVLQEIC